MGQQVTVSRDLVFQGAANYQDNIKGNPSFEKVVLYDDFLGPAVDETNDWDINEGDGGTGDIVNLAGGVYRLTTGTVNNDKCEITRELTWYAAQACVMEARVKVDDVDVMGMCVGFTDIEEHTDNTIAFEIASEVIEDRGTDGACFAYDTDATYKFWYMCNTLAGAQSGTSTGVLPVADTYEVLRVALDTTGNAYFYLDGAYVGFKALAVTTTADLTPYVGVIMHSGGVARNLDIDYIKCWQNRV